VSTVVVYDSNFGNTAAIAQIIATELARTAVGQGAAAVSVDDLEPESLAGLTLLVVGSPIIGWRPTEKMQAYLATLTPGSLTPGSLSGVQAAAFDTRVRLFIHGNAAAKISKALEQAGALIVAKPHGFIVEGSEGPLAEGQPEQAAEWARSIAAACGG
jgi:flavodoxin